MAIKIIFFLASFFLIPGIYHLQQNSSNDHIIVCEDKIEKDESYLSTKISPEFLAKETYDFHDFKHVFKEVTTHSYYINRTHDKEQDDHHKFANIENTQAVQNLMLQFLTAHHKLDYDQQKLIEPVAFMKSSDSIYTFLIRKRDAENVDDLHDSFEFYSYDVNGQLIQDKNQGKTLFQNNDEHIVTFNFGINGSAWARKYWRASGESVRPSKIRRFTDHSTYYYLNKNGLYIPIKGNHYDEINFEAFKNEFENQALPFEYDAETPWTLDTRRVYLTGSDYDTVDISAIAEGRRYHQRFQSNNRTEILAKFIQGRSLKFSRGFHSAQYPIKRIPMDEKVVAFIFQNTTPYREPGSIMLMLFNNDGEKLKLWDSKSSKTTDRLVLIEEKDKKDKSFSIDEEGYLTVYSPDSTVREKIKYTDQKPLEKKVKKKNIFSSIVKA